MVSLKEIICLGQETPSMFIPVTEDILCDVTKFGKSEIENFVPYLKVDGWGGEKIVLWCTLKCIKLLTEPMISKRL